MMRFSAIRVFPLPVQKPKQAFFSWTELQDKTAGNPGDNKFSEDADATQKVTSKK